jgi:hypothetical protein
VERSITRGGEEMMKKDYNALAKAVSKSRVVDDQYETVMITSVFLEEIEKYMLKDNPRFNKQKFEEACQ